MMGKGISLLNDLADTTRECGERKIRISKFKKMLQMALRKVDNIVTQLRDKRFGVACLT